MLQRQLIALRLLDSAERPLTIIEWIKLLFLHDKEGGLPSSVAFYDFLPYKFGPYSFLAGQEINSLTRDGYVKHVGAYLSPGDQKPRTQLPASIAAATDRTCYRYRKYDQGALVDLVYSRYPEYTVNSKLKQLATLPIADPAVYTIGYEGKSIDLFLNTIICSGIKNIVDVRNNPVSRKWGYSARTLDEICRRLNLTYHHMPILGIQSEFRQDIGTKDKRVALLDQYERNLGQLRSQVQSLANLMLNTPSVLVCFEACQEECHRGRLSSFVSELSGLPVVHL